MTPRERVREEAQKVAALIVTARRLLAGGAAIDLSALEGQVRAVCEGVTGLDTAEGRALLPTLDSLVDGLDGLAGDLRAQFHRLGTEGG